MPRLMASQNLTKVHFQQSKAQNTQQDYFNLMLTALTGIPHHHALLALSEMIWYSSFFPYKKRRVPQPLAEARGAVADATTHIQHHAN